MKNKIKEPEKIIESFRELSGDSSVYEPELSIYDIVKKLYPEIKTLRTKKITWNNISLMFKKSNCDIPERTLRIYFNKIKREMKTSGNIA